MYRSVGGNTVILGAKDDNSGLLISTPAPKKTEKIINEAMLSAVMHCNSHGHKVDSVHCDDEACMRNHGKAPSE
jgi:DNA-binding LacI/PurR family transcriptional regulator